MLSATKKLSAVESLYLEISLSITGMLVNTQNNHFPFLLKIFILFVKAS